MEDILEVAIRKRNGALYIGRGKRISSFNDVGPFDIYPKHTNFVSVVKQRLEIEVESGTPLVFSIDRGILRVRENKVEIYIGV